MSGVGVRGERNCGNRSLTKKYFAPWYNGYYVWFWSIKREFDSLRGNKMVIWSSGLGAGLQTQLGGFDSYYHLNKRVLEEPGVLAYLGRRRPQVQILHTRQRVRWKPKNR